MRFNKNTYTNLFGIHGTLLDVTTNTHTQINCTDETVANVQKGAYLIVGVESNTLNVNMTGLVIAESYGDQNYGLLEIRFATDLCIKDSIFRANANSTEK